MFFCNFKILFYFKNYHKIILEFQKFYNMYNLKKYIEITLSQLKIIIK